MSLEFHLQIVNATPYPLKLKSTSRHQMTWDPPSRVEANSFAFCTASFEIKYGPPSPGHGPGIPMEVANPNSRDDRASAIYEVEGRSGFSFEVTAIKAGMDNLPKQIPEDAGYGLQVRWTNIPQGIAVFPPRDQHDFSGVGWILGGTVTIGLGSATGTDFPATSSYRTPKYGHGYDGEISGLRTSVQTWAASWMAMYHECLRNLTLTELTMPGAHDAASFGGDQFLMKHWVRTQHLNLNQQLMEGIRALDLRLKNTGEANEPFQFVHGSFETNLSLTDGLAQIWAFVNDHPSEIVILDFHKLQESWKLADVEKLVKQLTDRFGTRIVPKSKINWTYGNLIADRHHVVIGMGRWTEAELSDDTKKWIADNPLICSDSVEQHWLGSSVTTWETVADYMTGQLINISEPNNHLWALMSQYNDIPDLGTPANVPIEISNFFTGRNGLRSNIVDTDWWNRLHTYDASQEAGCPNYAALINAVPLNLLKGYRRANNLPLFGPYTPPARPEGAMAGFALNGKSPRVYYQDTDNNIGELRWGEPKSGSWSDRTLNNGENTPPPAPGSAFAGFVIDGDKPRIYHLDRDNNVIERAAGSRDWGGSNLTKATNLPAAASSSALIGFAINGKTPRVYYRGDNGNVIELAWGNGRWGGADITKAAKARSTAQSSALAGFTINSDTLRVYCVDERRQVIELAYDRAWGSRNIGEDLRAPTVRPGSPLVGFAVNGPNSRVYYLDDNLNVIELYWTGHWNHKNVTSEAKIPRAMAGTALAGFAMRTDNWCVYFIDDRNNIFELAWTGKTWQATNLTAAAQAPAVRTGSALLAYALNGNAARLYYTNEIGQVIELTGKDGVWGAGSIPR